MPFIITCENCGDKRVHLFADDKGNVYLKCLNCGTVEEDM
jgi:uncharacterized Zn finger protein